MHIVVAAVGLRQQRVELCPDVSQYAFGICGQIDGFRVLGEDRAAEVGHRGANRGDADVRGQDDSGAAVKRQHHGWPIAAGNAGVGFLDQSALEEGTESPVTVDRASPVTSASPLRVVA